MVSSSSTRVDHLPKITEQSKIAEAYQGFQDAPKVLSGLSNGGIVKSPLEVSIKHPSQEYSRGADTFSEPSTNSSTDKSPASVENQPEKEKTQDNDTASKETLAEPQPVKPESPRQSATAQKGSPKEPSSDPKRLSSDARLRRGGSSSYPSTTRSSASQRAAAMAAAAGLQDEVLVGTRVSEGHENFVTAYNMLTGIRVAVSRCTAKNNRKLTDNDFRATELINFDLSGGGHSPSSKFIFQFKDYSPWVFRHLRDLFRLDPADYLMSLTAKYIVSELGSPGKSGSFFYYSRDYRFIIKTIRHSEHKLLRNIIRQYYNHVQENPNTLISQFYGLHRVRLPFGRKIHFVVMNNVFPALYEIHERFDLKGSLLGREYKPDLSKPIIVYKDLDWLRRHRRIVLGPQKREALVKQLEVDTKFLQSVNAMDYSLLIGIHDMSKGNAALKTLLRLEEFGPQNETLRNNEQKSASAALKGSAGNNKNSEKTKTLQQDFSELQMLLKRANPEKLKEFDFADEYRSKFYFYKDFGGFQSTDDQNEDLDVIYYVGVIDFLTGYTLRKRIETFCKTLVHDRKELSAVPAREYGDRFLKFLRGSIGPAIPSTNPQKRLTDEFKVKAAEEKAAEEKATQDKLAKQKAIAIEKAINMRQASEISPISVKTKSRLGSAEAAPLLAQPVNGKAHHGSPSKVDSAESPKDQSNSDSDTHQQFYDTHTAVDSRQNVTAITIDGSNGVTQTCSPSSPADASNRRPSIVGYGLDKQLVLET